MTRVYDELQGDSLGSFYAAIKSEETKENYSIKLRQFLKFASLKPDDFVKLARKQPDKAEKIISKYIAQRKSEGVSASTIAMFRDSLKLLLTMNKVKTIEWELINRTIPAAKHHGNDRPPTTEEIRNLLMHADLKLKCVILLLVSSGMRIGAIDYLKWGDIEEIKHGKSILARVRIYAGEPEEYTTLTTPEAYDLLLQYRKIRESAGEKISGSSPLFINDLNKTSGLAGQVKPAKSKIIRNRIGRLWAEAQKRETILSKGGTPRYEFRQVHGFRKFYKTTCERFMKSVHVEILMGHSIGVSNSYMKPSLDELLEDYLKAIPALTILTPVQSATKDEIMAVVNRQTLLMFGYSEAQLEKMGDLSAKTPEEMKGLIEEKNRHLLGLNGRGHQKVVPMSDVRSYIEQGWEFVQSLPTNEAVIGIPLGAPL